MSVDFKNCNCNSALDNMTAVTLKQQHNIINNGIAVFMSPREQTLSKLTLWQLGGRCEQMSVYMCGLDSWQHQLHAGYTACVFVCVCEKRM